MIRLESSLGRYLSRIAQAARRPRHAFECSDAGLVAFPAHFVDVTITAADVVKGSGAVVENVIAGGTVTAGQPVYLDSTDSNKAKAADANASSATAAVRGIALHGATANQPLAIQTAGDITLSAVLTAAEVFILSATAGGIAPVADITTGWRLSVLGFALTTSSLRLAINNSDTAHA